MSEAVTVGRFSAPLLRNSSLPMPLNFLPRLAAGALTLTLAWPARAVTSAPQATPTAVGEASPESLIAAAARLRATDAAAEQAQLSHQLDTLRREEVVLRRQLQAKQAEQARSAAGSAQSARLGTEIAALQAQIDLLEAAIQQLNSRLQSVPSTSSRPTASQAGPAHGSNVPPPGVKPAGIISTPVIPPDKIKAAAARFSGHPAPTASDARQAAAQIIRDQPAGAAGFDVEQLALLVMQRAEQDNEADLRNLLAEMKQKNDQKAALRAANPATADTPDNPNDLSPEDRRRLLALSERQTKLEQAIIELARPPTPAPNPPDKKTK